MALAIPPCCAARSSACICATALTIAADAPDDVGFAAVGSATIPVFYEADSKQGAENRLTSLFISHLGRVLSLWFQGLRSTHGLINLLRSYLGPAGDEILAPRHFT
jgi:hypothetical protein